MIYMIKPAQTTSSRSRNHQELQISDTKFAAGYHPTMTIMLTIPSKSQCLSKIVQKYAEHLPQYGSPVYFGLTDAWTQRYQKTTVAL